MMIMMVVATSLHPDVLEWLSPGWVYHTNERKLVVFSECSRPRQYTLPGLRPTAMLACANVQLDDVNGLLQAPHLRFEIERPERELHRDAGHAWSHVARQ